MEACLGLGDDEVLLVCRVPVRLPVPPGQEKAACSRPAFLKSDTQVSFSLKQGFFRALRRLSATCDEPL